MDYSNLTLDNFYNLIFDEDDYICFGEKLSSTRVNHYRFPYGRTKSWFTVNPLDPKEDRNPTKEWHRKDRPRRADCNVVKYRNIMIEMDSCPIPEQKVHIRESQMPYSTCVYSGGKSLHFIISLVTPLETEIEYRCWWKAIFKIMANRGAGLDPSSQNPSSFTRCPNVYREDKGQIQHLLKINARVKNEDMIAWFKSQGVTPDDFKREAVYDSVRENVPHVDSNATDAERFEVVKRFMKDDPYVKGNMNNWQFKAGCVCKAVGLREDVATEFIRQQFGPIDKRGAIASAYQKQVNRIQVKTTAEWLEEKTTAEYETYLAETKDLIPMTLDQFKVYSKTKWRLTGKK
jgi:phage gp16-like protein